jgi:uncharacterized protein YbjT (DUF2867 family)
MKIVVIGGTGLIGSKVVAQLGEAGHDAVAAAPNTGVNTITGEGLDDVLAGASVVVDVSNSPVWDDAAVLAFFETSTSNLLAAATSAGVGHYVALSVVGSERLPDSGYLRAKVAQEKLIASGSLPYSLVRATQFFEFVDGIADGATRGDEVHIAPVLFQPMAADDVARAITRTALGAPLNGSTELAGPDQFRMDEFFRDLLAARGDARRVITDEHAQYFGTQLGERSLVPLGDAALGHTHFAEWRGAARDYPVSSAVGKE